MDGVEVGDWEWFRKDGVRMRSGYFAAGQQTGKWTTYDKTGGVVRVTTVKTKAQKKPMEKAKGPKKEAAEAKAKGLPQHSVPQGLDIKIGRNCYIGSHAIIVGPLTIGDGAMICAGAVVTQDVPVNAFVAGNPARIFRIMDLIGEEPEQHVQ